MKKSPQKKSVSVYSLSHKLRAGIFDSCLVEERPFSVRGTHVIFRIQVEERSRERQSHGPSPEELRRRRKKKPNKTKRDFTQRTALLQRLDMVEFLEEQKYG